MEKELSGKVIVITGASSGFGRGVALRFAELGASLVLAARRVKLLDELAMECRELGAVAAVCPTDVSSSKQVERLYEKTIGHFAHIDVWINNAGVGAIGRFTDIPLADHIKAIDTDLKGTLFGSYCALKAFQEQGYGTLINVSSMLGRIPAPYYATYSAAKHAVVALSASLRQEMTEQKFKDINVCSVLPMAMDTDFFNNAANHSGFSAKPIPPLCSAEEVIDVLVDLVFNPKPEVTVGKGSMIFSVSEGIAPQLTEWIMGKHTHKNQFENSPPVPPHSGILQNPVNPETSSEAGPQPPVS